MVNVPSCLFVCVCVWIPGLSLIFSKIFSLWSTELKSKEVMGLQDRAYITVHIKRTEQRKEAGKSLNNYFGGTEKSLIIKEM